MKDLFSTGAISHFQTNVVVCVVIILTGIVFNALATVTVKRLLKNEHQTHIRFLISRLVRYVTSLGVLLAVMTALGADANLLLGAAGVLSVGAGFAARGVISNIVSGFVLIAERPFSVGDLIQVGDIEGEVIAIDLLAVRLASLDNRMVRIPNEVINNSTTVNLTHFPIRRIDIKMTLDFDQSTDELNELLRDIADNEPLLLAEPLPRILFDTLQQDGQHLKFWCWSTTAQYWQAKAALSKKLMGHFRSGMLARPLQRIRLHERDDR